MQMVEESEPLHKITIIPRGVAYLGATMQLPERDRYMEGRVKLLGILAGLMGGRVAESLVFDDITSGASSDLKEATRIARLMVCDWGMSRDLGPQTFGEHEDLTFLGRDISRTRDYSEETAQRIDTEVSLLLRKAYERARTIITEHRDRLDTIASLLLERETLDGRDVEDIIELGRVRTEEERGEARAAEQEPEETGATAAEDAEPERGEASDGDAEPAAPALDDEGACRPARGEQGAPPSGAGDPES
jgi:cell division protease FtsH